MRKHVLNLYLVFFLLLESTAQTSHYSNGKMEFYKPDGSISQTVTIAFPPIDTSGLEREIQVYNAAGKIQLKGIIHLLKLDSLTPETIIPIALSKKEQSKVLFWVESSTYYETGELESKTTRNGNGYRNTIYYKNGKVKKSGDTENGVRNGKYESFDENGNPIEIGSYFKGEKQGEWIKYSENGKIYIKEVLSDQKNYQKYIYYPSGNLQEKTVIINGNGDQTEFYQSGNMKKKTIFQNGKWLTPKNFQDKATNVTSGTR
jgi:antitoxin component YwqK of YwqJK toxin-antitoxin module